MARQYESGKSKYTAAAMVGINPTPTLDACCNHVDNPLIAKVLHSSDVGTWFIPVLMKQMNYLFANTSPDRAESSGTSD